jgi:hypothetical protein
VPEAIVATPTDLDEHDRLAVAHDQIDLDAGRRRVACDDLEAVPQQERSRAVFTGAALVSRTRTSTAWIVDVAQGIAPVVVVASSLQSIHA